MGKYIMASAIFISTFLFCELIFVTLDKKLAKNSFRLTHRFKYALASVLFITLGFISGILV